MISRRSSGIAKRSRVSGFSVPHFALSITRFIGSALAVSPASPNTSLLPFQAGLFFLLLRGILFRAFYILGSCAVCQTVSYFFVYCVQILFGQSQLPRFSFHSLHHTFTHLFIFLSFGTIDSLFFFSLIRCSFHSRSLTY